MSTLTRGPLPASVYWRRRLVLLTVALVLVLGIGKLLGGGDGSDPGRAAPAAADASPTATVTLTPTPDAEVPEETRPTQGSGNGNGNGKGKKGRPGQATTTEPVLAAPAGRCDGADVAVTPEVSKAIAGRDVTVVLNVRTITTPACTWRVNRGNVTLSITSGRDGIWSTRTCGRALPGDDIVVRNNVTTAVPVTWNAARMDDDCTRITEWAMPGYYHATAAALGGEPSDVQFELKAPVAATVTKTAEPRRR
ncbi:hypothetical protein GGQ22_00805 [Nocardioides sp. zg-579]|uniref:DUF4232 domain-containing protein n=1 Tax=Nocardioides marmotae TaxID=2663857 RepID=A0A6I3IY77_9ACTN|nr:hypothetical protein [Nocardioides marmotae]MCR6029981.1 hypothetical protein [Gordonia jinghuaiqii]MTB93611.1 hypothetical protein [Nocardioides marmotae]QKD99972.1 hypothetical protein HPC71_01875 [Nocardioides marmotae]